MPSLGLLLLCVACAAAQPPEESFIVMFLGAGERNSTPLPSSGNHSTSFNQLTHSYASGGLVHLDSNGTVLDSRPEEFTSKRNHPRHLIVNPLNSSVCWMRTLEDSLGQFLELGWVMRCAPLANLSDSWDLPAPRLLSRFSVKELAFDAVNQNWYLTATESFNPFSIGDGRSYVCSYLFEQCLGLEEIDSFLTAYDIRNRQMFRITETGLFQYQLEALQLDGSGKKVLVDELDLPLSLAVDSVTQQVTWLENTLLGGESGYPQLFRIDYDGKNKRRVAVLEYSESASIVDAVAGEVFIAHAETKAFSRINLSTGEQTTLFRGWNKVQSVPWLPRQDVIAFKIKKVQPLKEPDSRDICNASTIACRDLCIPTVVNDIETKSCFCEEGYELADFECRKKYAAFAVVAAGHELRAVDLETDQVTTILSDLTNATKLDFFWKGGEEYLLFWVDDGSVFQGQWSPGGPVSHVQLKKKPRDGSRVMEVAVDRASQHVYWLIKDDITYEEGSVAILQMASFQGLHVKTVHVNSWENQRDLAIFRDRLIFLLDKEGFLWEAELALGHHGVLSCSSLLIKLSADKWLDSASLASPVMNPPARGQNSTFLFWVDRLSQSVGFKYNPFTLPSYDLVTHPSMYDHRSLDVLRSRLFWLDSRGQLWTLDFLGGRRIERDWPTEPRMVAGLAGGRAVRVLHPSRQLSEYLECRDEGGCSHFCVEAGLLFDECACPDGLKLAPDQKLCEGPRMLFPGPPIWTPIPTSEYDDCPGRKYSEPEDLWATIQ